MASNLRWISLAALGAGCFALALGCSEDASSPDSDTAESGGTSNCADADCGSGGATGGGLATGGSGGTGGGSAGAAGSGNEVPEPLVPLVIYLAGDSTVATYADTPSPNDQAGWGQMLHEQYNDLITVENHAIGGRTARRFIEEGRLTAILDVIQPGDYLFVQFGTNDGNKTATYDLNGQTIPYYLDPDTDFQDYLREYIAGARSRDATLVFVTPPPRNSAYCTGGNGTGAHAQAMRNLAAEEGVLLSDLNAKTVQHLQAICPAPTPEDFFFLRQNGTVDGTHFQENGARIMAGFVADGVEPLQRYRMNAMP